MLSMRRKRGTLGIATVVIAGALIAPGAASAAADLSIDKRDSTNSVAVGETFTYTLDVRNAGPDQATGVTVVDDLPNDLDLASATPSQGTCDIQGPKVTCNLGTLASGATATVTLKVSAKKEGTITNTATVSGTAPGGDPQAANNQDTESTVVTPAPPGPAGPTCKGQVATIVGTDGADVLIGTVKRDVIVASGGDDWVKALAGKDIVCGGAGNDILKGGDDDDVVRGGGGDDRVRGNAGNDNLGGGAGQDRLGGGPGDDLLKGGPGKDSCRGGPGDDTKRSC